MESWLQDVRFGFRTLRKNPGVTLLAVVAMAVAIGAASTLFAVVNGVLLNPLPFRDADRLVAIWQVDPASPDVWRSASAGNFVDWRRLARSFDAMAAGANRSVALSSFDDPETPLIRQVSAGYFELLGVEPQLGRTFRDDDDRPGAGKVLVLSHELWQRRFSADPRVIGRTTELDDEPYEIVGVMPEGFDNPAFGNPIRAQLWLPFAHAESGLDRQGNDQLVMARLAPGVTVAEARQEMARLAAALREEHPEDNRNVDALVTPLAERLVRGARQPLLLLFGAVLFVLVVASANVANLLLTRAVARQREIAVRRALGAGRRRLARQLVTESLLITLAAGGLGLALAAWGSASILSLIPEGFNIPRLDVGLDGSVLAFTLGVALAAGLALGLISAAQATAGGLERGLGVAATRATGGRESRRLRAALVVGEVALSLMLLVGAGLMLRSAQRLARLDPGFAPESLVHFRVSTRGPAYEDPARRLAFFREVLDGIRTLPGVTAAGVSQAPPFFAGFLTASVTLPGEPPPVPGSEPRIAVRRVLPGYFDAMGIPLLGGRDFRRDDDDGSQRVAVVSRTLARRLWGDDEPLGETLDADGASWRVVGLSGDVRTDTLPPEPGAILYLPLEQDPVAPSVGFVVRTHGEPLAMLPAFQQRVWAVDRGMPVYLVQTMDDILTAMDWQTRFLTQLLGLFALLALGLAATGIYAVLSYAVSQRRREIGIRMALGARRGEVLRMMLGEGLGLAGAGIALGLAGALALSRLLAAQLYGITATDPLTYGGLSVLLATLVLLASYLPARRATRVHPVETLGAD